MVGVNVAVAIGQWFKFSVCVRVHYIHDAHMPGLIPLALVVIITCLMMLIRDMDLLICATPFH